MSWSNRRESSFCSINTWQANRFFYDRESFTVFPRDGINLFEITRPLKTFQRSAWYTESLFLRVGNIYDTYVPGTIQVFRASLAINCQSSQPRRVVCLRWEQTCNWRIAGAGFAYSLSLSLSLCFALRGEHTLGGKSGTIPRLLFTVKNLPATNKPFVSFFNLIHSSFVHWLVAWEIAETVLIY